MTEEQLKKTPEKDYERVTGSSEIEEVSGFEVPAGKVRTPLGAMVLSMFEKGQYTWVRVGSPSNSIELFEHAYDSVDEANSALLDAQILTAEQVPDPTKVVGTGIHLERVTAEQLEAAGLKRHLSSNL